MSGVRNTEILALSNIYETESIDGGGEENFLNAVLKIATELSPHELLHELQEIEARMGRPRPPRAGARPMDIDILLFDDIHMTTPDLVLPHPRMLSRPFVLRPLCDVLDNGWVSPMSFSWDE